MVFMEYMPLHFSDKYAYFKLHAVISGNLFAQNAVMTSFYATIENIQRRNITFFFCTMAIILETLSKRKRFYPSLQIWLEAGEFAMFLIGSACHRFSLR